jgi:hypothetical protein
VPSQESGLFLDGEVRDMAQLNLSTGQEALFFALNNDSLQIYLRNDQTAGF